MFISSKENPKHAHEHTAQSVSWCSAHGAGLLCSSTASMAHCSDLCSDRSWLEVSLSMNLVTNWPNTLEPWYSCGRHATDTHHGRRELLIELTTSTAAFMWMKQPKHGSTVNLLHYWVWIWLSANKNGWCIIFNHKVDAVILSWRMSENLHVTGCTGLSKQFQLVNMCGWIFIF